MRGSTLRICAADAVGLLTCPSPCLSTRTHCARCPRGLERQRRPGCSRGCRAGCLLVASRLGSAERGREGGSRSARSASRTMRDLGQLKSTDLCASLLLTLIRGWPTPSWKVTRGKEVTSTFALPLLLFAAPPSPPEPEGRRLPVQAIRKRKTPPRYGPSAGGKRTPCRAGGTCDECWTGGNCVSSVPSAIESSAARSRPSSGRIDSLRGSCSS